MMPPFRNRLVSLILLTLLTASCEHVGPLERIPLEPTLTSIQANIFSTNCALSGCHAGAAPQQGMNLSEGQAHANVVNVRSRERPDLFRVAPGSPDSSYLFLKITGAPGIVGERMPRGRAPLSAEQISAVRQWIADDALDN
ncbi:MAG: c-type cytochrome [Rhodothermales bacterium]